MDGEYIKVDRLVAFIKQNGYVYANSLYEMGEDAVSRLDGICHRRGQQRKRVNGF